MLDLDRMNRALLGKWWVRFQDPHTTELWKSLIIDKYGPAGSSAICSPFWKGILKEAAHVSVGFSKILGNGATILFWKDRWFSEHHISFLYPNLFMIAADPDLLAIEALQPFGICVDFVRQLTDIYLTEWRDLHSKLTALTPDPTTLDSLQ